MCIKTGGAEKTGEWESRIWTLRWIGEKANAVRTANGKQSDEWEPGIWTLILRWIEENVSAARGMAGFLNRKVQGPGVRQDFFSHGLTRTHAKKYLERFRVKRLIDCGIQNIKKMRTMRLKASSLT